MNKLGCYSPIFIVFFEYVLKSEQNYYIVKKYQKKKKFGQDLSLKFAWSWVTVLVQSHPLHLHEYVVCNWNVMVHPKHKGWESLIWLSFK